MGGALKQQPNEIASNFQPQDEQNLMKEKRVPKKIEPELQAASKIVEGKDVAKLCTKISPIISEFAGKCPYPDMKKFLGNIDFGPVDHVFAAMGHETATGTEYYTLAIESPEEMRMVTLGLGQKNTTLTVSDMQGNVHLHALEEKGAGFTFMNNVARV